MSPVFVRRTVFAALAAPALAIALAGPASSSPPGGDPLYPIFGEGCRYVAVDTPTDIDPEAEACRPWGP